MKIEYYRGKNRKWFWRMQADNGKVICDGAQGYVSKGNATKAILRFLNAMTESDGIKWEIEK
jgi:uncharacterized protein YegP (UPF0339 family)